MKNIVTVNRIYGPKETFLFDFEHGTLSSTSSQNNINGNVYLFDGHVFSLYVDGNALYFQWDKKRWNISDIDLKISYWHDFQKKITVFSVDDMRIEYPAWWRDDPHFNPNMPEMDEDEDYLGYVFAVKRNHSLQGILLESWSYSKSKGSDSIDQDEVTRI